MKKHILCGVMFFAIVLVLITACQNVKMSENQTPVPSDASSDNSLYNHSGERSDEIAYASASTPVVLPKPQSSESSIVEEPGYKAKSLFDIGEAVYAADLGIDGFGPYFYWEPNNEGIMFQGYIKDAQGKFTSSAFYYNIKGAATTKILEGGIGKNYFLEEPVWSPDGNEVLLSFNEFMQKEPDIYVYNLKDEKLETLPISGGQGEFSVDGSMIIFVSPDGGIHIYQRREETVISLPKEMRGHSPLWFSDSRHILFFKDTGRNPFGLEGGELYSICILDTQEPEKYRIIGEEKVYQNLHWIIQDSMAWVDSGWDDGHYVSLLDINESMLRELGADGYCKYLSGDDPRLILSQGDDKWMTSNIDLNKYIEYNSTPSRGMPLTILPDDSLLLWQGDTKERNNLLKISRESQKTVLTCNPGYLYPRVSSDGSKLAFIDSSEKFFIFIDTTALCGPATEENLEIMKAEEQQ